jgi:hypothetical protein
MAAGLGFKTFNTGDVLTAADTNGYLMQGILVFATEAARDAAIAVPAEGQFAFTKDNNTTWFYDGAAWVLSGATGDITGVTTGVSSGLAGGVTSGTADLSLSLQFNAQTGTTYTLVAADRNKLVTSSNGSAVTITIPTGVFAAGEQINVQSIGVGLTTISGAAVTITSTGASAIAPILRARYSAATIICTAAGVFTVIGDLA